MRTLFLKNKKYIDGIRMAAITQVDVLWGSLCGSERAAAAGSYCCTHNKNPTIECIYTHT